MANNKPSREHPLKPFEARGETTPRYVSGKEMEHVPSVWFKGDIERMKSLSYTTSSCTSMYSARSSDAVYIEDGIIADQVRLTIRKKNAKVKVHGRLANEDEWIEIESFISAIEALTYSRYVKIKVSHDSKRTYIYFNRVR